MSVEMTVLQATTLAMARSMQDDPAVMLLGEDVGQKNHLD